MQDRIDRLERINRLLVLALVALGAFFLGNLTREGSSALRLPSAAAQPDMKTYDSENERPAFVFTTSDSGSTLYEYRRQNDGTYKRLIWSS